MAESTQGSEFSEEQMLTLSIDRALRIWFVITGKETFRGIEWNCLSAELRNSHHCLFATNESEQLAAGMPNCKQAVDSAVRRTPQSVLHAVYKSLLDTRTCGGAVHHVSVAEEIQKEARGEQQPIKSTAYPAAADPGWPSHSKLASAECDRVLYTARTDTDRSDPDLPHRLSSDKTSEMRKKHEGQSTISKTVIHQASSTPHPLQAWPEGRTPARLESCTEDTHSELTAPEAAACKGREPRREEWKGVVAFVHHHLKKARKDVLSSLLSELNVKASHILWSPPSQQRLFEAIEAAVKMSRLTWFQFAQYLLRSKSTRPYIFHVAQYSCHFIRAKFKRVLKNNLGSEWYQLALAMGLDKLTVDTIDKDNARLEAKINNFLEDHNLPAFESDTETAIFLVEALKAASLPNIAAEVRRDLENALNLEDIGSTVRYAPKWDDFRDVFRGMEGSVSAEAAYDENPPQQGYEGTMEEGPKKAQTSQHSDPEERQPSLTQPEPKGTNSQSQQENGQMCNVGGDATLPLVAASSGQHKSTDPPGTSQEPGKELAVITVTPNDDAYAIFAVFNSSMSEDDFLETVTGAGYSELILTRQEDNKHLVHFAAERGYVNVLRMLHEAGHKMDVKMKNGQTPFLLACEAGHEETIKFILKCKASLVYTEDALGRSCLHFPAILRNKELMYDLIWNWDAEINATSRTQITPLSVGCIMGDLPIVQTLVQAMILRLDRSGRERQRFQKKSRLPPLHAAAFGGHQHIMEYLLSLDLNEQTDHEIMLELIDPDHRSEDSFTALHIAACKGYLDIVRMLVEEHKCMVDAAAKDQTTPLLLAATSGHEDVVEYLLDNKADMHAVREVRTGTFHLTPLGEAALGRQQAVVNLLLANGADFTFKAGGTTSILALACIGGDQEIVDLLLKKLERHIETAVAQDKLYEIFEMPFVVSMDFDDFKCAKQIMDVMNKYITSIDGIIQAFSGKVEQHMIFLLRQYKDTVAHIPDADLFNHGDTCRRVAGSRSSPMYHLCYDDGPHWGTEPMQLCFMFESFHKPEQFHTTYKEVYVEASKCILQTLLQQDYSYDQLANIAIEKGSEEAAQFFWQYQDDQGPVLFLEKIHSGNPTAMGICCELVSADILQEVYSLDLAGPVARQYFMEMSRRDLKRPGQFRMKFSRHGGSGTGVRLLRDGQAATSYRPCPQPTARAALTHQKQTNTTPVSIPEPTKPQRPPSDSVPPPSAPTSVEDKPAALEASGSLNPHGIEDHGNVKREQSTPITMEDCAISPNGISEDDLCMPVTCSQEENQSEDSTLVFPDTPMNTFQKLRTRFSLYTPGSSLHLQHIAQSDPSHTRRYRSHQMQHTPDLRVPLTWSHAMTTDSDGAHGGSGVKQSSPPSSPSLKLHQQSQSLNASDTQKSDESIGSENTSKNVLSQVEAQTGVGVQLQASQGTHSQDQSSTAQNPLREVEKIPPAELARKSAVPTTPELSQHQKAFPGNAEKSLHVTAPELNQHSDVAANSEPVTDVKGRSDPCPLLPHASASPQHLLQQTNSSLSVSLPPSSGPVRSNTTTPQQPNASVSFALQPSSGPVHSSATPEVPKVSRPDTIGGDLQDNIPAPVNAASNSGIDEGLPDSEPEERDSVATRLLTQPSPSNSTQFMHLQNSSQSFAPATSDKTHHLPSIIPTKEHSLLSNPASHPNQKSAPIEDTSQEETSDDDDDARSDLTYQSSTTSGSTTRNPTTEDSRNSSLSQALHPPIAGMQPRTSSLLTVTPALGTAGSGKMTSFADMHAPVGPQSNATGDEQSQTSVQSVEMSVISREQQLSNLASHPTQQSAPPNEDSFDGETSYGDDARVMYQSSASASATHTRASLREPPLSAPTHPPAHRSQPPTTLTNRSVNASSHMEHAKVRLPPSEVPSMIDKSAETYPSAATVVEAAHEADVSAVPASSSPVEQPVVVSSGEGCPPVLSRLENVYRQDSGYLGSHHFVSSNILHRHPDRMEPSDRMPMDSYQREQDSQESVQRSEPLLGLAKMNSEDGGRMREDEMLAYVSRQVGQKWSMLARYAGLEEDEIQQIKQSAQDRPRATMKKILERLTWNELLDVVQKHMHMLNTAAKLQHFLGRPVDALPDLVHNEIDPQQYSRTLLVASQCVSEHWKELAQYLGIDPHQHWDVLEESSDADEKCHGVLLLWLSDRRATLQELLEAVESTSAAAGSLQQLIETARLDGQH